MAAPRIKINTVLTPPSKAVTAATTVTFALDSTDGVRSCVWSILATDETTEVADYALSQSGSVGQTCTTTSLAAGTAALVKVQVNGGIDLRTELPDPDNTVATAKFYVATTGGLQVGCAGEGLESDATTGSTGIINTAIRGLDAVIAPAPATAAYVLDSTTVPAPLASPAVAGRALAATLEFASTTVVPFATKRTDAATAAMVDVQKFTAISTGTAAAGFGPSWYAIAKSASANVDIGRWGFKWTDTSVGAEDSDFVVRTMLAGSLSDALVLSGANVKLPALATVGGGTLTIDVDGNIVVDPTPTVGADINAYYLTNATAGVNANDVPVQNLSSTLSFIGVATVPFAATYKANGAAVQTALYVRRALASGGSAVGTGVNAEWRIPDGNGADTIAASMHAEWTDVLAAAVSSKIVWKTQDTGTLTEYMSLDGDGKLRVNTLSTGLVHSGATGIFTSSLAVNADVDAAAAIAGTKISPDFGAQNIVTTGTAATGVLTATLNAIATTSTDGMVCTNTTAATAIATVQYSPNRALYGRSWVSSADTGMGFREYLKPRADGSVDVVRERNTGSGWTAAGYYTNSLPTQYEEGEYRYAFAFGGGGCYHETTRSGFSFQGATGALWVKNKVGCGAAWNEEDYKITTGASDDPTLYFDASGSVIQSYAIEFRGIAFTSPAIVNTFASTLVIDLATGQNFYPAAITGNVAIETTNSLPGMRWTLVLTQDVSGAHTATFSNTYFHGGAVLNAAFDATADRQTSYFFLVVASGKSVPIGTPLGGITVP